MIESPLGDQHDIFTTFGDATSSSHPNTGEVNTAAATALDNLSIGIQPNPTAVLDNLVVRLETGGDPDPDSDLDCDFQDAEEQGFNVDDFLPSTPISTPTPLEAGDEKDLTDISDVFFDALTDNAPVFTVRESTADRVWSGVSTILGAVVNKTIDWTVDATLMAANAALDASIFVLRTELNRPITRKLVQHATITVLDARDFYRENTTLFQNKDELAREIFRTFSNAAMKASIVVMRTELNRPITRRLVQYATMTALDARDFYCEKTTLFQNKFESLRKLYLEKTTLFQNKIETVREIIRTFSPELKLGPNSPDFITTINNRVWGKLPPVTNLPDVPNLSSQIPFNATIHKVLQWILNNLKSFGQYLRQRIQNGINENLQHALSALLDNKNMQRLGIACVHTVQNLLLATVGKWEATNRTPDEILLNLIQAERTNVKGTRSTTLHALNPPTAEKYMRCVRRRVAQRILRMPLGNTMLGNVLRILLGETIHLTVQGLMFLKQIPEISGIITPAIPKILEALFTESEAQTLASLGSYMRRSFSGWKPLMDIFENHPDVVLYYIVDKITEEIDKIIVDPISTPNDISLRQVIAEFDDYQNNPAAPPSARVGWAIKPIMFALRQQGRKFGMTAHDLEDEWFGYFRWMDIDVMDAVEETRAKWHTWATGIRPPVPVAVPMPAPVAAAVAVAVPASVATAVPTSVPAATPAVVTP